MVERVAFRLAVKRAQRALPDELRDKLDILSCAVSTAEIEDARAAIEAMREPPREILGVLAATYERGVHMEGPNAHSWRKAGCAWYAMIDAALSEAPQAGA